MDIKEYHLSIEIKKQLGQLIRYLRNKKMKEYKSQDFNPYTKEQFCDHNEICHYHTLTKLENDYIREDYVYHILLKKLDMYFQVEEEEHFEYMLEISKIAHKMIDAVEKDEHWIGKELLEELLSMDLDKDCIAHYSRQVIIYCIEVFMYHKVDIEVIHEIEGLLPSYNGGWIATGYLTLGYGCLLLEEYKKALEYSLKGVEEFNKLGISIGFSYIPLIECYLNNNNTYEAINICTQLEEYYINTSNKARLLSIYIYLSDYYLLINSEKFAQEYYNEAIVLVKEEPGLSKNIYKLYYNWGMSKLKKYLAEEALPYFQLAYTFCKDDEESIKILNRLLMCMTILKYSEKTFDHYLDHEFNLNHNNLEHLIYYYFVYKIKKKEKTQEFALKRIVPQLKELKNFKIVLLFFYEDLFNSF